MKSFIMVGSCILLIVGAISLFNAFSRYRAYEQGQYVNVMLKTLPNCNYGYKNKFLKLDYNGIEYVLRTACKYTKKYEAGQQIKMLHIPGSNIFLFPEEDVKSDFLSGILILIVAIGCLIYGIKKSKSKT